MNAPSDPDPPSETAVSTDSAAPTPRGRRGGSSRRRWLRRAAIALVLLLALAPTAWLLREPVTHPLLVRAARWAVPRYSPYALELDALHGDWFSGLELEGLRVVPTSDDAPLRRLVLDRGGARWNLRELLRDPLAGLEAIEVGELRVTLDLARGASSPTTGPGGGFDWPGRLPRVQIASLDLELALSDSQRAVVTGGRLQLDAEEAEHPGELSAATVLWDDSVVHAEGPVRLRWTGSGGAFDFEEVSFRGEPAAEQLALDLSAVGRGSWSVAGTLLLADARTEFSVVATPDALDVEADGQALDLGALAALGSEVVKPWDGSGLGGRADLHAKVHVPFAATGELSADVRLDARRLRVLERRAEVLALEGRLVSGSDGYAAHISRGELREGPNELLLTDVSVPLAWRGAESFITALDGHVRLDARDLGLWVATGLLADRDDVPEHHLVFDADLSGGTVVVERGELVLSTGSVVVERGTLAVADAFAPDGGSGGNGVDVDLAGIVALSDLAPLEGILGSAPWAGSLAGSLAVTGRTPELDLDLDLAGTGLVVPGFTPGDVELVGRLDQRGVEVQSLEARGDFGTLGAHGELLWDGLVFRGVRVVADVERPELVPGMADLEGSWHLDSELEGPLAQVAGVVRLHSPAVAFGGAPLTDVELNVQLVRGEVVVEDLAAVTPAGPISASGHATGVFDDNPLVLVLSRLELSKDAERLALAGPVRVEVDGDRFLVEEFLLEGAGGHARGNAFLAPGTLLVDLELVELDPGAWFDPLLPAGAALERADARVALQLENDRVRLVSDGVLDLVLPPLPPHTSPVSARLAWDARLVDGRLVVERASLASRAPTQLAAREPSEAFEQADEGAEEAAGFLPATEEQGAAQDSSVAAAEEPPPVPADDPALAASEDAEEGGGPAHVPVEWFSLSGSVPLAFARTPANEAWPLGPGALEVEARVALPADFAARLGPELVLQGDAPLDGELLLTGSWSALAGHVELRGTGLRLAGPSWASALFERPASVDVDLTLSEAGLVAQRLSVELPDRVALALAGSVGVVPDATRLLVAPDELLAAPIDLSGEADLHLLDLLAREVPGVRRLDGRLTGGLRLGGTLGSPELDSHARLTDGELRLTGPVPALSGLAAELHFDGQRVVLEEFVGEIGGAPFEARGSVEDLAGEPQLEFTLAGENLLLARAEGLRIRADCDLLVRGPVHDLLVTGTVGLRNSRFSMNIDPLAAAGSSNRPSQPAGIQLFSLPDPPLSDLRFDVAITTAEPFVVASNFVAGSLLADLRLGGTGAVPQPVGNLFLRDTRARLPAGTIDLPAGVIEFRETNPFVPVLDVRGETRLAGHDVRVYLSGPYNEPEVVLSSNPPLPNYDLVSLLLTGRLPVDHDGSTVERATESLALYLARDAFTRNVMGPPGEGESLLDRFEYTTGREVSQTGNLTSEGSFRLGNNVLREGDTLYMMGERDTYDEYNFGLRLKFRLR